MDAVTDYLIDRSDRAVLISNPGWECKYRAVQAIHDQTAAGGLIMCITTSCSISAFSEVHCTVDAVDGRNISTIQSLKNHAFPARRQIVRSAGISDHSFPDLSL